MINLSVKTTGEGSRPVENALVALKRARVLVGIPEAKGKRRRGQITNAQLLFIHSNGSPIRRIPKRMVIEPAIVADGNRQRIEKQLGNAAKSALDGDRLQMERDLDRAGQAGESASKAWFRDPRNGWPPDKPATVKAKLRKLKGPAKRDALKALASGQDVEGVNTTLVDTAQMRRAITHVVET